MRTKVSILLLSGIPIVVSFLAAIVSQYLSLLYCKQQIDNLSEKLFEEQIMYTKLLSQSISSQMSGDLQKHPLYLRLINTYYTKVLTGKVIFNPNHKNTLTHIEMLYSNQEDPQLIQLYKKSSVLVNSWYHKNISKINELSPEGQALINNVTRLTPLFRTIELERNQNNQAESRFLQYNLAFIGYQYDGMMFSNTINNTYAQAANPQCGAGKYSTYDPRCRGWYKQAINKYSVHFQQPILSFTEKQSYMAQAMCQRMLMFNETTNIDEIHHVLCFNVKLSALQNYFQNYAKSTKQTYVIDPISQNVVFDSSNRLNGQQTETLSSLELNFLESKEEARKFNQTVQNQFQFQFQVDRIDQNKFNSTIQMQILNPYIRNGTKNYLLFNPVYVFDKLPQSQGAYSYFEPGQELNFTLPVLKDENDQNLLESKNRNLQNAQIPLQKQPGQNWNAILAYLQVNIISDEDLREQSKELNGFFNNYFIGVCSFLLFIGVISIVITVFYSLKIRNVLLSPIQQLIDILNRIHEEKDLSQILSLISDGEINLDELFHSKETRKLYESLNEVFKIMRFSQENFYKDNLTKTLLHLHDYLDFFKKFENNYATGIAHNNIGCILLNQNHFCQALEHFQQAIVLSRYEIQKFCLENPIVVSSQILLEYCFDDIHTFQLIQEKKQLTSISVNVSNNSQNIRRFTQQRNSQKQQELNQNCIINSQLQQDENKISSFEKKGIKDQYQDRIKLKFAQRKCKDIQSNQSCEYYKQKIDLITTLYYRKKNYIITLIAFQEQLDELIRKSKHKNEIIHHNFWFEIKVLLKELLNIASELPIWHSQQIEILLNISKCQFKLNKNEKYNTIMQFCEELISKLVTNQNYSYHDFNNTLKLHNQTSVRSQEEYLRKSLSPMQTRQIANMDILSNHQLSLNPLSNQNLNLPSNNLNYSNRSMSHKLNLVSIQRTKSNQEAKFNQNVKNNHRDTIENLQISRSNNHTADQFYQFHERKLENNYLQDTNNLQHQSTENINQSGLALSRSLKEKQNIFKANQKFKQNLHNKISNNINLLFKIKTPLSDQDQDEIFSTPKQQISLSKHNLSSNPVKSRLSLYQLSKKSTKASLQSNTRIEDINRRTTGNTNREFSKSERVHQDMKIDEEDEEISNEISKIEFDFMFSKSVVELLRDMIQSEYYIHNEEFQNACTTLTNILENSKYVLSHIPFIITGHLANIFQSKQIYSRELQNFSNQFNKQLTLSITIIYADQTPNGFKQLDENTLQEDHQQHIIASQKKNNNTESYDNKQESNEINCYLTQIVLLKNLVEIVLTQRDDSMSILKINKNEDIFQVQQVMEQLPVRQIQPLLDGIIEKIIEIDPNQPIFRKPSINNNIHSSTNMSMDSKLFSQLDEQEHSFMNNISPFQTATVSNQQRFKIRQMQQSYNLNLKSPFQSFSNYQKSINNHTQNEESKKRNYLDENNSDVTHCQNQIFQKKNQTQNLSLSTKQDFDSKSRNSSLQYNENTMHQMINKNQYKSYQDQECNNNNLRDLSECNALGGLIQEKFGIAIEKNKAISFSNLQLIEDQIAEREQHEKIQFNYGDQSILNNSTLSHISLPKEENINQKGFDLKRNQQFHYSIRKALDGIIHPIHYQFQQEQSNFHNNQSIKTCEKQVYYQNPTSQLKKYVIYQTDEINIFKNKLFDDLCSILADFRIQLIILSSKKGSNFLEREEDQFSFKQNIKVFYSVTKLTQYLESQRNKFNSNVYPSYLQHF